LAPMAAGVASRKGTHPQADDAAAAVEGKDHRPSASTGVSAGGAGGAQTGDAGRLTTRIRCQVVWSGIRTKAQILPS